MEPDFARVILHIDFDAYYTQVLKAGREALCFCIWPACFCRAESPSCPAAGGDEAAGHTPGDTLRCAAMGRWAASAACAAAQPWLPSGPCRVGGCGCLACLQAAGCCPAGLIAVNYPARARGITRHMRVRQPLKQAPGRVSSSAVHRGRLQCPFPSLRCPLSALLAPRQLPWPPTQLGAGEGGHESLPGAGLRARGDDRQRGRGAGRQRRGRRQRRRGGLRRGGARSPDAESMLGAIQVGQAQPVRCVSG
jgi:hypothetical protein